MRDLTKLALSSLVLLAGVDPSIGNLQLSPAVEVAPHHATGHTSNPAAHAGHRHDARARPGLPVPPQGNGDHGARTR